MDSVRRRLLLDAAEEISGITIDWVPKATLTLSPTVSGADGTATIEIVPADLPGATPLAVAFAGEGA